MVVVLFVFSLPNFKTTFKVKKLFILLALLTFPSVLYVILSTGKTNFIHLNYFGEKKLAANGKDTVYQAIPAFQFINEEGQMVTAKTLGGKIYVASFFSDFDNPTSAKTFTELLRVQEKFMYTNLPSDEKNIIPVKILTHALNIDKDSVQKLKSYFDQLHADARMWSFVAGGKNFIHDIAVNNYLLNSKKINNSDTLLHTETLVLIDKEKHIRGFYNSTNIKEVNNLLDDIKVLIAEYFVEDSKKEKK